MQGVTALDQLAGQVVGVGGGVAKIVGLVDEAAVRVILESKVLAAFVDDTHQVFVGVVVVAHLGAVRVDALVDFVESAVCKAGGVAVGVGGLQQVVFGVPGKGLADA